MFKTKTDPTLVDAQLVGKYASETGVSVPALRDAITKAKAESVAGNLTTQTEQELLSAQGDAIKSLQATNLNAIRGWYSLTNKVLGFINRSVAFLVVFWCLINIVPLTFLYSDSNARVNNIGLFCNEGSKINNGDKIEEYLKKCLAWNYSGKDGIAQADLGDGGLRESSGGSNKIEVDDALVSIAQVAMNSGIVQDPPAPPVKVEQKPPFSSQIATIKVFLTPPSAMLWIDLFSKELSEKFPGYAGKIKIFSPPLDEKELEKFIKENPGSALYNAAHDYGFMVYVLGSGYLPMLYGMLGAAVFLLRRSLSNDPADYLMVTSGVQTLMRIGLGGVAGIIIGWFNIPNAESITTLASTQFAVAFLAGFSIDIVFALLDRTVSVFDFKR